MGIQETVQMLHTNSVCNVHAELLPENT